MIEKSFGFGLMVGAAALLLGAAPAMAQSTINRYRPGQPQDSATINRYTPGQAQDSATINRYTPGQPQDSATINRYAPGQPRDSATINRYTPPAAPAPQTPGRSRPRPN